ASLNLREKGAGRFFADTGPKAVLCQTSRTAFCSFTDMVAPEAWHQASGAQDRCSSRPEPRTIRSKFLGRGAPFSCENCKLRNLTTLGGCGMHATGCGRDLK